MSPSEYMLGLCRPHSCRFYSRALLTIDDAAGHGRSRRLRIRGSLLFAPALPASSRRQENTDTSRDSAVRALVIHRS